MLKMRHGLAKATLWLRWIGDKSMAWHKQIGRRWSPQHAPQECQLGPKSKGEEQDEQRALDHQGEKCRHYTGLTIGAGLHQLPVRAGRWAGGPGQVAPQAGIAHSPCALVRCDG